MAETMKTNQEHFDSNSQERGNALIYVLIAIALFAALSMTLTRQTDSNEAQQLSEEKAELLATQLISTSAQMKSAIDQMLFSGSQINDLNFDLPHVATFDTGDVIHKVFHPQGGGITLPRLPEQAMAQTTTNPVPGWYMGRFNNIEWTASTGQDVILTAYQINAQVCGIINEKINGSRAIPALTSWMNIVLIDDALHSGSNIELTTASPGDVCPNCHNMASLCVSNTAGDAYSFYTIIADQ
jgi:hypothetical protein